MTPTELAPIIFERAQLRIFADRYGLAREYVEEIVRKHRQLMADTSAQIVSMQLAQIERNDWFKP